MRKGSPLAPAAKPRAADRDGGPGAGEPGLILLGRGYAHLPDPTEGSAMSTTSARMPNSSQQAGRSAARRPRGAIGGYTEARPGIITTEFWLTIVMTAVVIIFGYISDTFDNDLAWALGAGIVAAYVLSRGIAKAGSREGPFYAYMEDDDDGSRR